jgi:hypothetical protein
LQAMLIFLFSVSAIKSHAQNYSDDGERLFKGLLTVGVNAAQVDGDGPYGYNCWGLHAGVGTMINLGKGFSTSLEMLYSQRGSSAKVYFSPVTHYTQSFTARFNYVEVPVCLNYQDKKRLLVTLGLSPAVLANFNLKFQGYDPYGNQITVNPPECLAMEPAKFDLSALAGIQFLIKERIAIGGRYSYSLLSLKPPCVGETQADGQYHNVITFRATYIIGNKSEY